MSVNRVNPIGNPIGNPSMWKAIGGKDGISKDMSRDMPSMAIFMESSE